MNLGELAGVKLLGVLILVAAFWLRADFITPSTRHSTIRTMPRR